MHSMTSLVGPRPTVNWIYDIVATEVAIHGMLRQAVISIHRDFID